MAQEKRMASIIYRQNKWRAQVRKQGHRYFSKTFLYKDNARKWAHNLECEMDQGRHLLSDGRDLTLHLLFVRYLKDITILKKSRIKETQCLQRLMKENICVGMNLSRKEMYTAFPIIIDRLKNMRFAEGNDFNYSPNVLLRGLDSLHIEFDKA